MEEFIIFVGVPILILGFVFLSLHLDKKRTEDLKALASKIGYRFSEESWSILQRFFSTMPLFDKGRSRRSKNLLTKGIGDATLYLFDYQYSTGRGKSRKTRRYTIAGITSLERKVPDFILHQENFLHTLGSFVGYSDIDFSNHPEFSSRFFLRGANEEQVRRFFDRSLIQRLEYRSRLNIQASGGALIYYRKEGLLAVKEVPTFLKEAEEFWGLFRML